jgi:hypothetical protein
MKSKMVATAGLSLTLDPMGKMFQKRKSDWSLTVYECSLDGSLQSFFFCSDIKFKMAAMAELKFNIEPIGKMF